MKLCRILAAAFLLTLGTAAATLPSARLYVNASIAPASSASPYSTWETASQNLQDALALAVSGDEIWVAAGTYYPDEGGSQTVGNRSATFSLREGVSIYGGFAGSETLLSQARVTTNATILSGDIGVEGDATDNSYHILSAFFIENPTQLRFLILPHRRLHP
jgi:hypothetical protein|tara:strand:+ start:4912 stop:5397 length:486 start_codon:yes stop_codon:yes gene_type:complete